MPTLREPCAGMSSSIPTLGGCWQNNPNEVTVSVYPNLTTIYKFGEYITPVSGDGALYGPMICTASFPYPNIPGEHNCFQSSSVTKSLYACDTPKAGWKAIRADHYWCGNIPYNECLTDCWSGSLKYLRVNRKITGTLFEGSDPNLSGSLTWERQYFVDSGSGNITQEICSDSWIISNPDSSSVFLMPVDYGEIAHAVSCNQMYGSFDFATGTTTRPPGTDGNPDYDFAPIGLAGWILTERTLTATHASYTVTSFGPQPLMFEPNTTASSAWQGSITFTADLSVPYSLGSALADTTAMLNIWSLTDDKLYPWRQDNRCVMTPVFKREEKWRTPESVIASWGSCGTWTDTVQMSGRVLGTPLPLGYGEVSGSTPFGFYAFSMSYVDTECNSKRGWWTPTELPTAATWWTTQQEAGEEPCYSMGQYPKGAWLKVFSNNLIRMQKYVAIQEVVPSFDYNCRPCGNDGNYITGSFPICGIIHISSSLSASKVLITLDTAAPYLSSSNLVDFQNASGVVIVNDASRSVEVVDSTHVAIDTPTPVGDYIRSTGASGLPCDSGSKGDFIWLHWMTNQCDSTYTHECSQSCNNVNNPCSPPVMAVLPPGAIENFPNGKVLRMNITASNLYFQSIPIGNISDPYGVTTDYYEARCSEPTGYPKLFVSYSLGCWDRLKWTWGPEWCGQPANGDCTTYSSDIEIGI